MASFHEAAPSVESRLREFTARDWRRASNWLDVSGLALYFLDRLIALDLESCIPAPVLSRLRQNFAENRARTSSLLEEVVKITGRFKGRGVECALLKGLTLPPESVRDCTLRNQMDHDILIRESDAQRVKELLEEMGYSLKAISGNTWEFRAGPSGKYGRGDIYKARLERALDLHLLATMPGPSQSDLLTRSQCRPIGGYQLPALSAADTFVYQAKHLFKHICSDHTRASWVLEYWRHIGARSGDIHFWRDVEELVTDDPGARLAIGAATFLSSKVFGFHAPQGLFHQSTSNLPPALCLWIRLYWRRVLLSDTPQHKLYLLLLKELNPNSQAEHRRRRRVIFPFCWPQRVTWPASNETLAAQVRRHQIQARFVLHRLRFHIVEGLALGIESVRWQRRNGGVSQ